MKRVRIDKALLNLRGGNRPSVVLETEQADYWAHRVDVLAGGQVVASILQCESCERGTVVVEIPDDVEVRLGYRHGTGYQLVDPSDPNEAVKLPRRSK